MKQGINVRIGDKCYFYSQEGRYIGARKVETIGHSTKETLFFHFGFNRENNPINVYPNNEDTYSRVKTCEEICFFSKEAAIEYFSKKSN